MSTTCDTGVRRFDRLDNGSETTITQIGKGDLGAKANGLRSVHEEILPQIDADAFPGVTIEVPRMVVLASNVFTDFMNHNRLWDVQNDASSDNGVARRFQAGELDQSVRDDLMDLVSAVQTPVAVRSSSCLDGYCDAALAGIYLTKIIPNIDPSPRERYRRLVDAVKLVWASAFFADAITIRRAAGQSIDAERIAVIVQDVVGEQHGDLFYPTVSGVARSYNHYPGPGAQPDDGAVTLALGLGKTIVDGEATWTYSPERPLAPPPFKTTGDLLRFTQTSCWVLNLRRPETPKPAHRAEHMFRVSLKDAEQDGTIKYLASTYDAASDRLQSGLGAGPRALTFAPLLASQTIPFKQVMERLLALTSEKTGGEVQIDFSLTLDPERGLPMKIGILQMRPLLGAGEAFPVAESDLAADTTIVASENCLGNGSRRDLADVVYLRPEHFKASQTRTMAAELDAVNRGLVAGGRHGIFIGFGRWGTSDERSGVPVRWGQISAARVIVEATLPNLRPDLSQGAQFFHRVLNSQVLYMSVEQDSPHEIDWQWLDDQPAVWESHHVRHVRLKEPLEVTVDASTRRGIIRRQP